MPITLEPLEAEFAGAHLSQRLRNGSHTELPPWTDAAAFCATEIQTPPEIVNGILHKGLKMVVGGSSKARKSWLFLDLAIAVSSGACWLGKFDTTITKVLYVNFELPAWAIQKRLCEIAKARGILIAPDTLTIWNLRGYAAPYHQLLPLIIERANGQGFGLIILDPSYKLLGDADENSTSDIAKLLNEIEKVTVQTDAAVAFSAHFAKGNASQKEAIDRISGSGVFARDPDSILVLTAHESEDAYAVEAILRTLPPQPTFCVRWGYPVFQVAEDLDPAALKQARRSSRPTPTSDQMLALFKMDVENPRATLMTAVELRAEFDARRWDRVAAPAVRDRLVSEGKLKVNIGRHNAKLTGLPVMVDAYEKQLIKARKSGRKKWRKGEL
jgi:AAA domain